MSDPNDPIWYVKAYPLASDGGGSFNITERVLTLSYDDDEAKADKCTLTVDNYDLSQFDAPQWKPGARLEVSWGYTGRMSPPRTVTIQKVKGGVVLNVEALDPSVLMNKKQKVRTFEYMKRSEVAALIAKENGYSADQQHIDDSEEAMVQVTQARMTDAQLLRDMAKREGFEFYVDFDGFHFHKRKLGQKPLRTFTYFTDKTGDILTWSLENDIYSKGKAGGVSAKHRDPETKENTEAKGDNKSAADQTGLAPEKVIITGISERDGSITTTWEKESGSTAEQRSTEPTAAATKRAVKGAYAKNQLTAAELTLECRGDPAMIAKVVCTVNGIGLTLSGNYYCTNVSHKLSPGYRMTMKLKRDGRTSPNNAAAYAGEGNDKTKAPPKGGGVPAAGATNSQADPNYDATKDPTSMFYVPPLTTPIVQSDGSIGFSDVPGRAEAGVPQVDVKKDIADAQKQITEGLDVSSLLGGVGG